MTKSEKQASAKTKPDVAASGEQPKTKERKHTKKSGVATAGRPGRSPGIIFAFLTALLALLASGYLWYAIQYKERLLGSDLRVQLDKLSPRIKNLQETSNDLRKTLASVQEKQKIFGQSLQKLIGELHRDQDDLALDEVRQLLLLANHRLKLARDIDTAIAALTVADSQLEKLADPMLLDVRKRIAGEIAQLKTVERADIPGMALRLAGLTDTVDRLPLAIRVQFAEQQKPAISRATDKMEDSWRQAIREFWDDLLGLVQVRKITATGPPLLPPKQSYFLRENLRLLLTGAQIALLQNEVKTYQTHLTRAKKWLEQYFDTEAEAVRNFIDELENLRRVAIAPDLPNISGSLTVLNKRESAQTGP